MGGGRSRPRPGRFTSWREARYSLYKRLSGPKTGLDGCGKSCPPSGIRFLDRPARFKSLYRYAIPTPRYSLSTVIKPRTYSTQLNDPQRIRTREKGKLNPDRAKDNGSTDCEERLHSKYLGICFQVSRWRAGPSKRLFHTKLQLEREAEGGTQKTIVWIIYSSFIWKGWSYYIPMGVKNHINFIPAVEIPTLLTKVRDIRSKLLFLCYGSRNCLEVGKMQSADQLC